jgi:DNA-3-methyladenine glycosylase II
MPTADDRTIALATKHLCENDALLAAVIDRVGKCGLRPHGDYYRALVEAIIGQQLSVSAARAIKERFRALTPHAYPTPADILALDDETLRACGLSRPKVKYIRDLAAHIVDGRVELEKFNNMANEDIISELTAVNGIGEWTVHMYLIFCMGRLDVLPVGDLGIRKGIKQLYDFDEMPTADDIRTLAAANQWHPYESVASWYVWRSLELAPL